MEYVPYDDDGKGEGIMGLPGTDEDQYDHFVNAEVLLAHMDTQSNMFFQVDQAEHNYLMMDSITGHSSSKDAVKIEDQYMTLRNG